MSGADPAPEKSTADESAQFRWFRWVGMVEACSFLVLLLIAMPLKYAASMPEAVWLVGRLHGGLFVIYVVVSFIAYFADRRPSRFLILAAIASILPAGPLILDGPMRRCRAASAV